MHIDRISGGGPIRVGCKLISVSGILSNGGCRIDVAAPGALVQIPQTGLHPRGDGVAKCGAAILKRQGHRLGVGGPVAPGAAHDLVGHGDLSGIGADGILIIGGAVVVRIHSPHGVDGLIGGTHGDGVLRPGFRLGGGGYAVRIALAPAHEYHVVVGCAKVAVAACGQRYLSTRLILSRVGGNAGFVAAVGVIGQRVGLAVIRLAVIILVLRPHRVQGGVTADRKGTARLQNIQGSSVRCGGDKFLRRSAPPQEHSFVHVQAFGVAQDRDRAAVLIGALRICGHGAGAAVGVIGHRVGGQTGDGGGFVALNGQRLLLVSHVVGQHGVAVGVVGVVAGKAVRPHVQGHLIGQGVGFGFIFGILYRSGIRPVPGKSLSVLVNRHTLVVRQTASHQLDVFAHGVHNRAGLGGGNQFPSDAFKGICQIRNIRGNQIVSIIVCNAAQRIFGMFCLAAVIVWIAQVYSVNLIPGLLGKLCLDDCGLTVVIIGRGEFKISGFVMFTGRYNGTTLAAGHISITASNADASGIIKASPAPISQLSVLIKYCKVNIAAVFPDALSHSSIAILRLTVRKENDDFIVRRTGA